MAGPAVAGSQLATGRDVNGELGSGPTPEPRFMAGAGSTPRRAAVLGSPIAHSLSPVLHRAAYRELGLPWTYDAIEMTRDQLADFIASRDESWIGLSLTMPLKVAVLDLVDDLDPQATITRSANTVIFDDFDEVGRSGRRHGYNTDVFGITAALRTEAGERVEAAASAGSSATIIGAGATASSALAALAKLEIRDATLVARRPWATSELVRLAGALGICLVVEPWQRGAEVLAADIVISTVPTGVADAFALAVPAEPGVLLDVVYSAWPTKLASAWYSAGGTVVGGLSMLVWQAAEQVRLMTGREAPVAAMRRAGEAAIS